MTQQIYLFSKVGFEAGFSLIGERPLAMAPGITKQGAGGDAGLNWEKCYETPCDDCEKCR